MNFKDEKIAEEIERTRQIIRKKMNLLQEKSSSEDANFAKIYKPIIEPLENIAKVKIAEKIDNNNNNNNNKNVNDILKNNEIKSSDKIDRKKRKIFDVSSILASHSNYPNKRVHENHEVENTEPMTSYTYQQ